MGIQIIIYFMKKYRVLKPIFNKQANTEQLKGKIKIHVICNLEELSSFILKIQQMLM